MKKLSKKKKSELGLIAALTLDATLAAEEELSGLAERRRDSTRAEGKPYDWWLSESKSDSLQLILASQVNCRRCIEVNDRSSNN